MKNNLPYHKTSDAIIGYSDSVIAKNEKNDCVVRAVASSFEIPYDDAHQFVKTRFERKDRDGVRGFIHKMNVFFDNKESINGKTIKPIGQKFKNTNFYGLEYDVKVKGEETLRKMTVGFFTKNFSKGTFIVTVRGHAFTIKDGVVIGNTDDATKLRKVVISAWEVK